MSAPILQEPNELLRKLAQPVPKELFGTPELEKMLVDMTGALYGEWDGVAIAAPQIGLSYRIFIVRGMVFSHGKRNAKPTADKVFINPVIVKRLKGTKLMKGEGCLSVRWKYGDTHRSAKATVSAYDHLGNQFEMEGTGLLAQIFQHEIDHLDGILFIDHAENVHQMSEEEIEKYKNPEF
jgi:peptide deformylase